MKKYFDYFLIQSFALYLGHDDRLLLNYLSRRLLDVSFEIFIKNGNDSILFYDQDDIKPDNVTPGWEITPECIYYRYNNDKEGEKIVFAEAPFIKPLFNLANLAYNQFKINRTKINLINHIDIVNDINVFIKKNSSLLPKTSAKSFPRYLFFIPNEIKLLLSFSQLAIDDYLDTHLLPTTRFNYDFGRESNFYFEFDLNKVQNKINIYQNVNGYEIIYNDKKISTNLFLVKFALHQVKQIFKSHEDRKLKKNRQLFLENSAMAANYQIKKIANVLQPPINKSHEKINKL